jgi:hypothetical protein
VGIAIVGFSQIAAGSALSSLASEPNFLWCVSIPIFLALYYCAAIYWVRQTNPHSTLVTQYSPPSGMSPAEMRFVLTGEFDERVVAAAAVHLAARGLVRFQGLDQYYAVCKTSAPLPSDLPADELAVYRTMFNLQDAKPGPFPGRLRTYEELPHDAFLLPPPSEKEFVMLAETIKSALRTSTEQKYFTSNIRFIAPAAMLSLFLVFVRVQGPAVALVASSLITLGMLTVKVPEELIGIRARQNAGNVAGLRILFVMVCLGVFGALGEGSMSLLTSLAVVIALNLFLAPLLRARTTIGMERVQQIEGYREFLKQVEIDRMARMKTPEWVPSPSTEYLAFALALDLGNAWEEYVAHSGCEVLVVQKGKSGVFPKRVRLREPNSAIDAFLASALAMTLISGVSVTFGLATTKTVSAPLVPVDTIAAGHAIVFIILLLALLFRSRSR